MPRVFVNYRSDDGDFAAALLHLQLSAVFGEDAVFLDSRTIEPGQDFAEQIVTKLTSCTILLAVIGSRWLTTLDNATGLRRIDLPEDWVHRELLLAQANGIVVVPVLLDDTPGLRATDLPPALRGLDRAQYVRLRHQHAADDIERIARHLREQDRRLITVEEADLRAYVVALSEHLSRTQTWMPYPGLDTGYLDRRVIVERELPAEPPEGALYHEDDRLVEGTVAWSAAIRDVPIAVVLADAGFGKTWLLRHHCLRLCAAALADLDAGLPADRITVPMVMHAHRLAEHWRCGPTPAEALVDAALDNRHVPAGPALRRFLLARLTATAPTTAVVVDAYDEVFDGERRDALDEALGWLTGLVGVGRGPTLVLSSRPAGFGDPFRALVEAADRADDDVEPVTPRYLRLCVLAEHQVRRLWGNWFAQTNSDVPTEHLDPALAPLSAIRTAIRVPLIAAFAAWVAESAPVATNRSGLYGQVVDRFLGLHWKQGSPSDFGALRHDPALRGLFRRAFADLAWHMAAGTGMWRDFAPVAECEAVLAAAMAGAPARRSRTFDAVRTFGLLISLGGRDNDDDAPIAWIHRSVHQFIVAQRLSTLPDAEVARLVDERGWFRPEWRNVLEFAIGLEAVAASARPVTAAVRALALSDDDGLGWFATAFTAAAAGMPAEPSIRDAVVDRVWSLHRAGFLSATQLASVLALTPEADPGRIARIVTLEADQFGRGRDTWHALAWCGADGIAALGAAVRHSPDATGAAFALFQVAPDEATAALAERLRAGHPVLRPDNVVVRELAEEHVAWLRGAYRRSPGSRDLARALGWTGPVARGDLLVALDRDEPAHRHAAVCGLAAGFADDLADDTFAALLAVALHDTDRETRLLARGELLDVGAEVPWVRRRIDEHSDELHRDHTAPALDDLAAIAARLREIGPATVTAVVMLQEEPLLVQGPVRQALGELLGRALDGELDVHLTMQVTTLLGDGFVAEAVERLTGPLRLPTNNLRRLAEGVCRARPHDPAVFEAVAARVAQGADPALGSALRGHELAAADKARRLLTRLVGLPAANRPAVQLWTEVLWTELLNVPRELRSRLRAPCVAATRHVLDLAG